MLTDPVPDTVRIFFRGPQSEIFRITDFDLISVTVPITEMSDEEMVIQLQPGWVSVDGYRGVEVDDIVPGEINVRLDRRSIRTVPLRVSTSGALPDHLVLEGDLTLTPDVVQVDGPASRVDRLDSSFRHIIEPAISLAPNSDPLYALSVYVGWSVSLISLLLVGALLFLRNRKTLTRTTNR